MSESEYTDRYAALGIPEPDPGTMCEAECEGTGWVPISKDETEEPWRALWLHAERVSPNPAGDQWHFVPCPACNGTGRR